MLKENSGKGLISEICKILINRDPIGINFGMDNKEYEPEAKAISEKLFDGIKKEDLHNIVYEVFVSWFNKSTAGEKDNYLVIAEDILKLINQR